METSGGKNAHYHGWILYTEEESIRNRHYIELYFQAASRYGMSIELVICEDTAGAAAAQPDRRAEAAQAVRGADVAQADRKAEVAQVIRRADIAQAVRGAAVRPVFAVNRTRDYRLAAELEGLGVEVYNSSRVAGYGNDKAKAYRYLSRHGIPIMPTAYDVDLCPKQYPVVVKPVDGHGGAGVCLLRDSGEWQQWKRRQWRPGRDYVCQQAASDLGRDLRVYVVGNQIVASVLRVSGEDFRSNFSLGGQAALYELSGQQRLQVEQVMAHFDIGMAGIDFVFHQGRLVFNELEDMVGARMLYSLTEYDIVDAYVGYIRKCLDGEG